MKRQLTYKISKYSTYLKADEVDSEIARAFRVWENVTDFTFVRSDSDDDVEIEIRCCRSTATEMSSFSFFGREMYVTQCNVTVGICILKIFKFYLQI